MKPLLGLAVVLAGPCAVLLAQPGKAAKAFQTQSTSTVSSSVASDGSQVVEIRNVSYELTSGVPGRPPAELLLLRKTTHSKETLGDIGVDATTALEAWRLGDDVRGKPLYALNVSGTDGRTLDHAIFVVSRGLEEVDWWSVYKLGNGQHLLDTYVPLVSFSISRDTVKQRYVGLEVPEDDAKDARLKQPNVIAVLSYASEDHVVREALLTSDDRQQATLMRSFADVTRKLTVEEGRTLGLKLTFRENEPAASNILTVTIPLAGDDLDLAHAQLPAKMHIAAWKR